ncbi:UNVERIFIED_CONTAM: hypothetical protein GTU68_017986 [Idotea baltica]|nr:hypothetical protein [Idotea baltica]
MCLTLTMTPILMPLKTLVLVLKKEKL